MFVHRLVGVKGITDDIRIRPLVQAYEVREKIKKALEQTALFDAASISIKMDGGTVTLEGKVRDWHERGLIETAAWSLPGVSARQDRGTIYFQY
jgi:osmotically-inducible protein OsmY